MKKLILSIIAIQLCLIAFSQVEPICHTASTEKFAMFASNSDFGAEHSMPSDYIHVSQAGGEQIQFDCPDGKAAHAYYLKAKKPTNNWIFVFQEWWGLNDNVKRESENLYNDLGNVNVLALDMYDTRLATNREDAAKYMQEFKQERGDQIVKGALKFAGSKAKIGTVGWCFGGGQSLLAALSSGKQAVACVMYYGMPVDDVEILKTLNCDVLNVWATRDKWINEKVISKFEANMKLANKKIKSLSYDADHAFANPSNGSEIYKEEAYKDAYKNTIDYFKSRFK